MSHTTAQIGKQVCDRVRLDKSARYSVMIINNGSFTIGHIIEQQHHHIIDGHTYIILCFVDQ